MIKIQCLAFCILSLVFATTAWPIELVLDNDWSQGNYTSVFLIDPDNAAGLLLLKNDPGEIIFAFDPTTGEDTQKVIIDAVEYNDKLYMVASTDPVNPPADGKVFVYDYASDRYTLSYEPSIIKPDGTTVRPEGIYKISSINGKLYLPESDPNVSWDDGVIHIFDGTTWNAHYYPGIRMVHGWNIFSYHGRLYSSQGGLPPDGGDIHEAAIWYSEDEGETWYYEIGWSYSGHYFIGLEEVIIFNNKIVAGTPTYYRYSPELYIYNGTDWITQDIVQENYQGIATFQTYNNMLYAGLYAYPESISTTQLIWTSQDGEIFTPQNNQGLTADRCLGVYSFCNYDSNLYALVYEKNPHLRKIYESSDGMTWMALPSVLPGTSIEMTTPGTENIYHTYYSKLISYKGRVYVMFPDQGDVYVSASAGNGYLVSKPKSLYLASAEHTVLTWKAYAQERTSIKFQIRAATAKIGLADQPFIGPDGTEATYFSQDGQFLPQTLPTGNIWLQYRVVMEGIKVKKCCCTRKSINETICKYFILLYCLAHIIKPV